MNLSFEIKQENRVRLDNKKNIDYLLLLLQDDECMMSVFFPSDVKMHRGEAIDIGFERASSMGHAFITGSAS